MTTISSPRPSEHHSTEPFDDARRDRLRSTLPVVAATAVLLAALVGAALLAGNLVELGLFFMTAR